MARSRTQAPPSIRYEWRDKPLTIKDARRANPQRIGEELAKVAAAHDGRLKKQDALDVAQNPRSPLHRHVEWDDQKAARAYRLDQIGEIIRLIRVVEITDDHREIKGPAFVSINEGRQGTAYRPLSAIMDNLDLQIRVYQQAERDLEAWEKRYREITDICDLVRDARAKLAERRSSFEQRGLDARH